MKKQRLSSKARKARRADQARLEADRIGALIKAERAASNHTTPTELAAAKESYGIKRKQTNTVTITRDGHSEERSYRALRAEALKRNPNSYKNK